MKTRSQHAAPAHDAGIRTGLTRAARRRRGVAGWLPFVAALTAAMTGCASPDREINAFLNDWETTVSAADYQVIPPDSIEISATNAPEIDGEVQSVRQDGKVTLRLVGEVKVAGLTPLEIARKLESLLQKYYVDPKVSVRVTGAASKRFFVFGQVAGGGAYRYTGRDTVITALASAQPTFLAWTSQVKVIRPSHEESKRQVLTVNVDRIMQEGKLDKNFLLQEGDIIYVPPTPLAWVGLRIHELLFPAQGATTTIATPVQTRALVEQY